MFLQKMAFQLAIVLLLLGAGVSVYSAFSNKKSSTLFRVFSVFLGVSALAIMFSRDTYLPFLGETVMPCSALAEQTPDGADTDVMVRVPAGAKVLFWASEPGKEEWKETKNWRAAYLAFENVGVTVASADGVATLRVRRPQPYTVPVKGRLESHVHYRVCGEGAMLGSVETAYLEKGSGLAEEGFTSEVGAGVGYLLY